MVAGSLRLRRVQARVGLVWIGSTRIYLHLAGDWLAGRYWRAAAVIDAQMLLGRTSWPSAVDGDRWKGSAELPDWNTLTDRLPDLTVTMRGYLDQLECVPRPGSVRNAEQALRSRAALLADRARQVTSARHEDLRNSDHPDNGGFGVDRGCIQGSELSGSSCFMHSVSRRAR